MKHLPFFLLLLGFFLIAALNCTIEAGNTTCGTGTKYLGIANDTNGYNNAHAENYTNTNYTNSLCCTLDAETLAHTCQTNLFKLDSETNAHLEQSNMTNYAISACINASNTNITCSYTDSSCPSNQTCIITFANADGGSNDNSTNAHIGNCTTYTRKLCCGSNSRPSVPTLITPANNNNSVFSRYTYFNWTSTDPDGDAITYYWNLTSPAGCAVIPEKNTTTNSYTSVDKLCIVNTYNWTVKACDAGGCSAYATPFNFTIPPVVGITFLTNSTDFGSLDPSIPTQNNTKDTLTANPVPLRYNNTGNVDTSTAIKANAVLWNQQPLNTSYFQYADENSTNWQNFTVVYTSLFSNLTYPNGTRELEIKIWAPQQEAPGAKSTTITVLGTAIEP